MLNDLKAEFSHAYVRAVVHAAGYFVQEANRNMDSEGVDLTLFARGAGGVVTAIRLDVHLKATAKERGNQDSFPLDLDVKNYNELRTESLQIPRILVVVVVPSETPMWVSASQDELTIRNCGYWMSLRGMPITEN